MGLGELAAHHRPAVPAVRDGQLGQRDGHPAAGLEVDLGAGLGGKLGEAGGPLALTPGREALEAEPVGGQPGDGQRGRHRGRPGQRRNPQAGLGRGRHQPVARVADGRRARVGDEQDVLACLQLLEQARRAPRLDRVVVGNHPRLELDVQAGGQPADPARVLGRDQGGLGELGRQPDGRVFGPADRGRRQRQHAALVRLTPSPACLASRHVRTVSRSSEFSRVGLPHHPPASRTLPSPAALARRPTRTRPLR
jgi:hypothetical protein